MEFFGYDIALSEAENVEKLNEFVYKRADETLLNLAKKIEAEAKTIKTSKIPLLSKFIKIILLYVIVFFSLFFIEAFETSFNEAIKSRLAYFIIACGLVIVSFLLFFLLKHLKKRINNNPKIDEINKLIDDFEEKRNEYFEIPMEAKSIDILASRYQIKDEKIVLKNPLNVFPCFSVMCYRKDDYLCFCDSELEYSIKINEITSIKEENKFTLFSSWNKDESFNDEKYNKYQIKMNKYYCQANAYGIITFSHNNVPYIIRIGAYDVNYVQELIK